MAQGLKLGVYFDLGEFPTDYAAGTSERHPEPHGWRDLLGKARLAEDLGFDSVWIPDHLLFGIEDGQAEGFWECGSILAGLAASTSRVDIGTLVVCAAFRNPALLAKMAVTIDEISGGRLILGLGAGYYDPEFRAFGYPTRHRASRFEEAIQIIHGLLKRGEVDVEGRFYQARECELRPRGPRPEGPPILVAALGPRMMRIAARYADLWNEIFLTPEGEHLDYYRDLRQRLDAACDETGRDPATLGRTVGLFVRPLEGRGAELSVEGSRIAGTPAGIAGFFRRFADEGVSQIIAVIDPQTPAGIEALAPVLDELSDLRSNQGGTT